MKRVLLPLLLAGSMLFALYLPSVAAQSQDREQVTFNQAYGLAEHLSKNLKSSQWGSLTYLSGPNVIVGVPSQKMIPQVEAAVDSYLRWVSQNGKEEPFVPSVDFVACKYSQNKLNQIVQDLQKEEVVKKAGSAVQWAVNWDGFIHVTLSTQQPQLTSFLENHTYSDVMVIHSDKTNPAIA